MHRQITILTVLICFLAAPALAAQMSVEPVYQEAFQGDNITVNITVLTEGDESVYGASYALYFNNTLLNATSLVQGPFLAHDGNPSYVQYPPTKIINAIGEIKYCERKEGMVPGVTGYGVLTTITFQVIGEEGTSQLNLSDLDGGLLYSMDPYGPVPTTLNNGGVELIDWVCGDVTGEGTVNMGDVTKLLWNQTYWGQYPVDPGAADVTGEGNVNMGDVTKLLWNQTYWGQYSLTCC